MKDDFKELETITLKMVFTHKDGEKQTPLDVTVFPPAELVDGCESDIRVQVDARQAAFIRGFMADVLPDLLTTLDVMAERNGDESCDCENCQARRSRSKVIEPPKLKH